MATPDHKDKVEYAEFLHYINTPNNDEIVDLLAFAPKRISDKVIDRTEAISSDDKADFKLAVDAKRAELEAQYPKFKESSEVNYDKFHEIPSYTKVFSDFLSFVRFNRRRKNVALVVGIPLSLPSDIDILDPEGNLSLIKFFASYDVLSSAEGVRLDPVTFDFPEFPDNLNNRTVAHIINMITTLASGLTIEVFAESLITYLSSFNLGLAKDYKYVFWTNAEALEHAEEEFIKINKRFSNYYTNAREDGKYVRTLVDERLEALLEKIKSADVKKDDKSSGSGNSQKFSDDRLDVPEDFLTPDATDPDLVETLSIIANTKLDLRSDKWKLKAYACNVEGIRSCIADNGWDETNAKDVMRATMICRLISIKAIELNDSSNPAPPMAIKNDSLVSDARIAKWVTQARKLIIAAFHFQSQGLRGDEIRWYNSYANVFGNFVNDRDFLEFMMLLSNEKVLEGLSKSVDLAELRGENNVLQYRLTRISSPSLVKVALQAISGSKALEYVDPAAVHEYWKFYKAGVAAQIASGPLKVFCRGKINPLKYKNIPGKVTVSQLEAIENPPYNERLLKQTKIILDTFEISHGRWYQGEKALMNKDNRDILFEAICKHLKKQQAAVAADVIASAPQVEDVWANSESGKNLDALISQWDM